MLKSAIDTNLNELRMSLGADARFYTVKVVLCGAPPEVGWPLEAVRFEPGLIHMHRGGETCLIPEAQVAKVFISDSRLQFEPKE